MNNNLAILVSVVILSVSCSKTDLSQTRKTQTVLKNSDANFQNTITSDSMVICWDPPTQDSDSVFYYDLGYRTLKQSEWTIVKFNIPATDSPQITLYRNELSSNDSIFYFAVRTIAKNGLKSEFHSSADSTALPTDWFVLWKK